MPNLDAIANDIRVELSAARAEADQIPGNINNGQEHTVLAVNHLANATDLLLRLMAWLP